MWSAKSGQETETRCDVFVNNITAQLKGQCHENHFKNTRVQKHIYSNGKLQLVVQFVKNSNVSVKKLKKDVRYHYANDRN